MSALVDHLESRLGRMQGGWAVDLGTSEKGVTVGLFEGGRLAGVRSFATIGLSEHPVVARNSGRELRMELIGCSYGGSGGDYGPWPGILDHLAKMGVETGQAILRGDIIRLPGEMASGSRLNALYATLPVYFDDSFSSVEIGSGRQAAVVWLLPIGAAEADLIQKSGWRAFESVLESGDPDLLDLKRALVV